MKIFLIKLNFAVAVACGVVIVIVQVEGDLIKPAALARLKVNKFEI